jgi:hypothetical protein
MLARRFVEGHELRASVDRIGTFLGIVWETAVDDPELAYGIENDVLHINETRRWILSLCAVLDLSIGPGFFVVEVCTDDYVVGRLAHISRIGKIDVVFIVYGKACGWRLGVVDGLESWAHNSEILWIGSFKFIGYH